MKRGVILLLAYKLFDFMQMNEGNNFSNYYLVNFMNHISLLIATIVNITSLYNYLCNLL